jgi:hypothetical protein
MFLTTSLRKWSVEYIYEKLRKPNIRIVVKCEEDYLKNWQEIVNIVGIRNCFIEVAGSDKVELMAR